VTDILISAAPRPVKLALDARDIAEGFREGRVPAFAAEEMGAWVNAADWLMENGELEAAEMALRALNAAEPGLEWAANLCDLFDRAPPPDPAMPDFRDELSRDAQVRARAGAGTALILFCGARHRMGMPLPLIHRWLARTDASLIYLRDLHGLCYFKGVASLGPGLEATLQALRRTLDQLGARRVVCLGCSGGGYGALLYALELGGDAISLGSPANMEPAFNAHMNHGAYALQLKAAFPDQELDLRRRIEAAPRRLRTLIVYGDRNWNERIHAEHMAGLEGAALYPVTGYGGHATAAELMRRDEFSPMLEGFLA
jgi:hypothetical protein